MVGLALYVTMLWPFPIVLRVLAIGSYNTHLILLQFTCNAKNNFKL